MKAEEYNAKYKSMVFFSSWYEKAMEQGEEFFQKAVKQLLQYGLYGIEPDNEGDPLMKMFFDMARPSIDHNMARKEAGRKGGQASSRKGVKNGEHRQKSKQVSYADADAYVNEYADADVNGDGDDSGLTPPAASGFAPLEGAALAATDDGVEMSGRELYERYQRNKRD